MNFYCPLYFESEHKLTIKFDTVPNSDVEVILQSMVAYKRMLLKTSSLLTGDYTENFEDNYPEILMIIDSYRKGSDVFDYLMKLVPKKHQQKAIVACTVLLGVGGLIWTLNQILDLYIKVNKISDIAKIEVEFEAFKKEVNEKLKEPQFELDSSTSNQDYNIPSSLYKIIDLTYDDYQTFVKPIKMGTVRKIVILDNDNPIQELTPHNSIDFSMELVNQKITNETHKIQFTKIDKHNKKSWKILLEDGSEVKAEIKDNAFFKKVELMKENPLNKENNYKVDLIEYWQREKGEEILSLKKVDILAVNS